MQKKLTYGQKISMVAAAPVLGLSSSVDAAVVYKNPTPGIGISLGSSGTIVDWDIDSNGTNDFRLEGDFSTVSIRALGNYGLIQGVKVDDFNLSSGATIGSDAVSKQSRVFLMFSSSFVNDFSEDDKGYIGFEFNIGENKHYGWASLTPSSNSLTIHDWAYNDVAGQSISAGDIGAAPVPLPPSAHLMLLALGAGGLTQWRSRRKAQESA